MEPASDPPPVLPDSPAKRRFRASTVVLAALGLVTLAAWLLGGYERLLRDDRGLVLVAAVLLLVTLLAPPLLVWWFLARLGRWRCWPAGLTRGIAAAAAAAWVAIACFGLYLTFARERDSGRYKSMIPRQPAAAVDQFFLENGDRIFVTYDEIVGPQNYLKAYNPVDGEDLRAQFPLRRAFGDLLTVRLPDGTAVQRNDVLAVIGRSGLVATFPAPQDDAHDPQRVYRLDNGVALRGHRVVDRPPDPAGRQGRDLDGVHTYRLPDGRRFEVTYRGGVPDGRFRAFYADGARWGEATYRQGRVVEARVFTRGGRRFDELKDGPAANDAMVAEAKAEADVLNRGARAKLAAKDYAGAAAGFTAALDRYYGCESLLGRSDAKLALGDVAGAIADCESARYQTQDPDTHREIERRLKALQQRTPAR